MSVLIFFSTFSIQPRCFRKRLLLFVLQWVVLDPSCRTSKLVLGFRPVGQNCRASDCLARREMWIGSQTHAAGESCRTALGQKQKITTYPPAIPSQRLRAGLPVGDHGID
jgi:hypothetical protein